jgi:hypothetical protein
VGGWCWFGDNIGRKLGNKNSTLFWKDEWIYGGSLKSKSSRPFDLFLDKEIAAMNMSRLGVVFWRQWVEMVYKFVFLEGRIMG